MTYHIFCNSSKFSLRNFINSREKNSYEDLKTFLKQNKVQPPNKDYYNIIKKQVDRENHLASLREDASAIN